ncbi:MAG: sulfurtransferase [Dehalococcoidia bacterium]|nr:sulfurtransferase [Dehalococcoidia bacterium]
MVDGPPEPQHPLLVTTSWLADRLERPAHVLIDCGEAAAYRRAHIPGAVGVPHPYLKTGFDGLRYEPLVMGPDEFQRLARQWGVSEHTPVILYDDSSSLHAARVWWVFDLYGHRNVRVLDGGFSAWLDEGWPLTAQIPQPPPGDFTARTDDSHLCRIDALKTAVERTHALQIWDARADAEWSGADARGNKRAGHLPGARHYEWSRAIERPPSHRFRPLAEIRRELVAAGINPEAETVTY